MKYFLTESQEELVGCKSKLVIGCAYPGTGKTSCLIERASRCDPNKTLITTFTRRCKNEIEARLSRDGHSVRVVTLHGLAYDLLTENWDLAKGMIAPNAVHEFPMFLKDDDEIELISSEFNSKIGLKLAETRQKTNKYRFDSNALLKLKSTNIYLPGLEREDLELLRSYDDWRISYGFFTIRDLIPLATKILKLPVVSNNFYTKYSQILIDEVQDLSEEQWLMLEPFIVFADNLFVIGDMNQSIFSYAGGDGSMFKKLLHHPQAKVHYLVDNFRSGSKIVETTNSLISSFDPKMVAVKSRAGKVDLRSFKTPEEEIEFVNSLDDDFVILARTNSLLEPFKLNPDNKKTFMTIHSSKGKEWDKVVLIGASDRYLPHAISNDIKEERNIFYVGISRAKEELIVTYSGNPSMFLKTTKGLNPKT